MTNILPFRCLKRLIPEPVRPSRPWPLLPAAVQPGETQEIIRAQSILSGPLIGACPPLTIEQARDVLRWSGETLT